MSDTLDIQIEVTLDVPDISMEVSAGGESKPPYEGDYTAVSDIHDLVRLPTKGRSMLDDVVIQPIPFYEVSNPQGGVTITIGN